MRPGWRPTTTVSAVDTRVEPAAPTIGARLGHTRPSSKWTVRAGGRGGATAWSHTMRQSFSRRTRRRRPSYWRWPMPADLEVGAVGGLLLARLDATVRKVASVTRRSSPHGGDRLRQPGRGAVDDRGHGRRVEPLPGVQVPSPPRPFASRGSSSRVRVEHPAAGEEHDDQRRRPAVSPSRSTFCPAGVPPSRVTETRRDLEPPERL